MSQTTKAIGSDFAGYINQQAIPREVWNVIYNTSVHGWVATLFTCLVDARISSDKPGKQSIRKDDLHSGHRPDFADFAGFANHQAIPREVWDVIRGTSGHG